MSDGNRLAKKPWLERWSFIEELGGGGQGATFRVRSLATGSEAVLKVLKKQNDPERRRRMHREVAALETLDIVGVPRLLDANTASFADEGVPLYLVSEYVAGATLEERVARHGLLSGPASVALTRSLLTAVAQCHASGVVHRDIKPDNIVLRADDPAHPVLIDFGQSFNEADTAGLETAAEQQLGNRFLELPELRTPASDGRDARSDLTSCVGVLLYGLTGIPPRTLLDEAGRLPHQRENQGVKLGLISEPLRQDLARIFDVGFQPLIDRRWQSAPALIDALGVAGQERVSSAAGTLDDGLARLRAGAGDLLPMRDVIDQCLNALDAGLRGAQAKLGNDFSMVRMERKISMAAQRGTYGFGFEWKIDENLRLIRSFVVSITGTETVVTTSDREPPTTIVRFPFAAPGDGYARATAAVEALLLQDMTAALHAFMTQRGG